MPNPTKIKLSAKEKKLLMKIYEDLKQTKKRATDLQRNIKSIIGSDFLTGKK